MNLIYLSTAFLIALAVVSKASPTSSGLRPFPMVMKCTCTWTFSIKDDTNTNAKGSVKLTSRCSRRVFEHCQACCEKREGEANFLNREKKRTISLWKDMPNHFVTLTGEPEEIAGTGNGGLTPIT
ncbi:hypothetical protein L208DRAFT_26377 [Tricholoma matsutake]|nr:hypothetical protein L208DRAFT_26377 [Tricholoma matsutake 945]